MASPTTTQPSVSTYGTNLPLFYLPPKNQSNDSQPCGHFVFCSPRVLLGHFLFWLAGNFVFISFCMQVFIFYLSFVFLFIFICLICSCTFFLFLYPYTVLSIYLTFIKMKTINTLPPKNASLGWKCFLVFPGMLCCECEPLAGVCYQVMGY